MCSQPFTALDVLLRINKFHGQSKYPSVELLVDRCLKQICCMFSSTETNSDRNDGCVENLSSEMSNLGALESYPSFVKGQSISECDKQALKLLNKVKSTANLQQCNFFTIPCKVHMHLINSGVFAMLRAGSEDFL